MNQETTPRDVEVSVQRAEITAVSLSVFGSEPHSISYPGGTSRDAVLADMGDANYIFSKRGQRGSARTEAIVLRRLAETGRIPKLKAQVGEWIVQECLPGVRLPMHLDQIAMSDRKVCIASTLDSLLQIKEHAYSAGLERWLPTIGADRDWMLAKASAAHFLSDELGISPPKVDREALADVLTGERTDFIKYDARPGNALIDGDRSYWFDWEDCGFGQSIEDLAFVLGDEWTSLDEASELRLIETYLPHFKGKYSQDEARRHFLIYGTFNMVTRLHMALSLHRKSQGWWNREACLRGDKIGNTPIETQRLCQRIMRWSGQLPELEALVPWAAQIQSLFNISLTQAAPAQRAA